MEWILFGKMFILGIGWGTANLLVGSWTGTNTLRGWKRVFFDTPAYITGVIYGYYLLK